MRDLLIKNGWYFTRSCNCGGQYQEVFKNSNKPGMEVRIYPNAGKWRIEKSGRQTSKGVHGDLINAI